MYCKRTANQREVGQLSCVGVAIDTSPTQLNSTELNSTLSWVELRRYKRAFTDLKRRLLVEWSKLDHSIVVAAISQWRRRLSALTVDIYEHILWRFHGSVC